MIAYSFIIDLEARMQWVGPEFGLKHKNEISDQKKIDTMLAMYSPLTQNLLSPFCAF